MLLLSHSVCQQARFLPPSALAVPFRVSVGAFSGHSDPIVPIYVSVGAFPGIFAPIVPFRVSVGAFSGIFAPIVPICVSVGAVRLTEIYGAVWSEADILWRSIARSSW